MVKYEGQLLSESISIWVPEILGETTGEQDHFY